MGNFSKIKEDFTKKPQHIIISNDSKDKNLNIENNSNETNFIMNIKSKYIIKLIANNIKKVKYYKIIKYSKQIQKKIGCKLHPKFLLYCYG